MFELDTRRAQARQVQLAAAAFQVVRGDYPRVWVVAFEGEAEVGANEAGAAGDENAHVSD